MPPHLGHVYLVDFARNFADELTVMVCSIKSEPIPGRIRYLWMKEMFPDVKIIYIKDENPQGPEDDPNFWEIWKTTIEKRLPEGADYLFASEDYGIKLAEILGMKYIPLDKMRDNVKISGTSLRKDIYRYWKYLPQNVRLSFVKKICIFGPESTGKSVLAKKLAEHFDTVYAKEYAREFLDLKKGKCDYEDIEFIARGQIASEKALIKQANRILFSDTDIVTTAIWSDILFNKCPDWIKKKSFNSDFDHYIILNDDVPFVADPQRYLPNQRQLSVKRCIDELEKRNLKYILIGGNWGERLSKSKAIVEKLLNNKI